MYSVSSLLVMVEDTMNTFNPSICRLSAGGSGPTVNLYDLRYVTGTKVIESYTPRKLQDCVHVSVSGIDVSRDKQELLISYENDVVSSTYELPWGSQSMLS
jgi:hypothetical protein